MITTVVFDLDDTLYDEIDYCRSGFAAVAEFLSELHGGFAPGKIFEAIWRQFTFADRTKVFNNALDELNMTWDKDLISELVRIYRNHTPGITLPADSEEILEKLSGKYSLALLTDGFLPAQRLKVKALNIEKFFKCIVYTEELGRKYWKPATEGFIKIQTDLKLKPENAVYIADNEKKDFIGPNKLGWETIQIIRKNRLHLETCTEKAEKPKYKIFNITEIHDILLKI